MLGIAKERLADQLGSAAIKGEGRQNTLCAHLARALLVGLLGNALLGAWWLDRRSGSDRGCCGERGGGGLARRGLLLSSPLDGAGFAEECCDEDCCGDCSKERG
jgi:hypothetical protein